MGSERVNLTVVTQRTAWLPWGMWDFSSPCGILVPPSREQTILALEGGFLTTELQRRPQNVYLIEVVNTSVYT